MWMIKSSLKDLGRWFYWYPFRTFLKFLPIKFNLFLGQMIGLLFFLVARQRKKIIFAELKLSLNEKEGNLCSIIRRSFENYYMSQIEIMFYQRFSPTNIFQITSLEGKGNLDQALKRGKGVILVFGHFGSNQMIMPAIGYRGYQMSQLSASATIWEETFQKGSPYLTKRISQLRQQLETSLPVSHIDAFGSLRPAFRCLMGNGILGIAIDGGGGLRKVKVKFLGRDAWFPPGTMELALKSQATVLPSFILRKKDRTHHLIIEESLPLENSLDQEENIRENTQRFVRRLEDYVRKYPSHYAYFLFLAYKYTKGLERSFFEDYGNYPNYPHPS